MLSGQSVPSLEPSAQANMRPVRAGNNHLVAYVTPEDADVDAAVEDMKQNVPEYMVPEVITKLAALPLLPNGKVNRRGLPEPKFGEAPSAQAYVAPRSRVEERIQATWHEVRSAGRHVSACHCKFSCSASHAAGTGTI